MREYVERRYELIRQRTKAAKAIDRMRKRLERIEAELSELDRAAKAFDLPNPAGDTDTPLFHPITGKRGDSPTGPMFKDIALNYLAASHLFPKKAADVQAHAEAVLGRSFHRRTAGRTLYRLSKKFEVVRRSQSWFFNPPEERGVGV